MVASARSYVLSPALLGEVDPDPSRIDRLSSRYLIAMAARTVREVAGLSEAAATAGQPLATLSLDADVRFANAADRKAFQRRVGGGDDRPRRQVPRRASPRAADGTASSSAPTPPRTAR